MPTYRAMQSQLILELRRARRYEYPLAVATLSLQASLRPGKEKADGTATLVLGDVTPAVYGLLGAYLRNTLRETDILTGMPEALAFATFLPGVDRCGATQAMERLRAGFRECAGFDLHGGAAAFPADALTIEDVLACACDAWRQASQRPREEALSPQQTRYSHG